MRLYQLASVLHAQGWDFERQNGSHKIYRDAYGTQITFSVHGGLNPEVPPDVLRSLNSKIAGALKQRELCIARQEAAKGQQHPTIQRHNPIPLPPKRAKRQRNKQKKRARNMNNAHLNAAQTTLPTAIVGPTTATQSAMPPYAAPATAGSQVFSVAANEAERALPVPPATLTNAPRIELKACKHCGENKPPDAFSYVNNAKPEYGRRTVCKECHTKELAAVHPHRKRTAQEQPQASAPSTAPASRPYPKATWELTPARLTRIADMLTVAEWLLLDHRPSALLTTDGLLLVWCGDGIQVLSEAGAGIGQALPAAAVKLLAGHLRGVVFS